MIRRWWNRLGAFSFFRELSMEYRRVEVQRVLRQQGRDWRDATWDEAGELEYVIFGDRQAYPAGLEPSR